VLADQQEAIEKVGFIFYDLSVLILIVLQKSQSVLIALDNATYLFQTHAEHLEKASFTASKIHDNLGNVAMITDFVSDYAEMLNSGGSWGDWAIRVISPPSAIIFGGHRLRPSLSRNIILFMGGA
jgi:hypothetical protein